MNLKTQVSACLCMVPFDNFSYTKIIPDEKLDSELAEFMVEKFKISNHIYNNLHCSKIEENRIKIFKDQCCRIKGINLVQWNFVGGFEHGDYLLTQLKDDTTTVYLIESKKYKTSYIIY